MEQQVRIRNGDWKEDLRLKSELTSYVEQNLQRREVLDFATKNYPQYSWSLGSLDLRLKYFDIKYTDYGIDLDVIERIVREELNGPGKCLGYRAVHKKLREVHHLNVPRDLVYDMMEHVDESGLRERGGVGLPKRHKRQKQFVSKGSDYTMSLDGHDKLCGFQKSMFPLAIYGGQDTYSGRINFLRIWTTNNDPKIIGRFYFDYLFDNKVLCERLRIDRGTETGILATIHVYLLNKLDGGNEDDPLDSIIHGPSTENKIERWWRELHHRLEKYFKQQLAGLLENGQYDPGNKLHRNTLAYIYIPMLQKELDTFRITVWNNSRGRYQDKKELPSGVPEHIYHFPEKYNGEKCGRTITEENLQEVAEVSDILNGTDDYLSSDFREKCQQIIEKPEDIKPHDAVERFIFLKDHLEHNQSSN